MAELYPARPTRLVLHHYPLYLLPGRLPRNQFNVLGNLDAFEVGFLRRQFIPGDLCHDRDRPEYHKFI